MALIILKLKWVSTCLGNIVGPLLWYVALPSQLSLLRGGEDKLRCPYILCVAKGRAQRKCNVSSCVLVISCITNYHILSSSKQHPFISSSFGKSKVQHGVAGLSVQNLARLKSRCQPRCLPIRGHWRTIWLNSAPCSCKLKLPLFACHQPRSTNSC